MEDLIKRSDAIRALNREKSDWNCDYNVPIDNCIKRLNKVKSADRPQGSWESWWNEDLSRWGARCTSCHKWSSAYFDFCPNCGAKMKGADDE